MKRHQIVHLKENTFIDATHLSSIHLSIIPSICPFIYHPSIHPSVCLSVHPSIHSFIHFVIHLSFHLSAHPALSRSRYPSRNRDAVEGICSLRKLFSFKLNIKKTSALQMYFTCHQGCTTCLKLTNHHKLKQISMPLLLRQHTNTHKQHVYHMHIPCTQ